MPKGYWIANNVVNNAEAYEVYKARNMEILPQYGAKFLVRGGEQTIAEGVSYPRTIVIEFPDYATALAAYNSPEYQENIQTRIPHSESRLVIVEGYGE